MSRQPWLQAWSGFNPHPGHVVAWRHFTMIISAQWLQTSNKLTWETVKKFNEKLGKIIRNLLSGCEFVQRIAQPQLLRDRKIKMHQSLLSTSNLTWGESQIRHANVTLKTALSVDMSHASKRRSYRAVHSPIEIIMLRPTETELNFRFLDIVEIMTKIFLDKNSRYMLSYWQNHC